MPYHIKLFLLNSLTASLLYTDLFLNFWLTNLICFMLLCINVHVYVLLYKMYVWGTFL